MLVPQKYNEKDIVRRMKICNNMIGAAVITVLAAVDTYLTRRKDRMIGSKTIKLTQKCVYDIFRELGLRNERKSYCMHQKSFWKLHCLLLIRFNKKKERWSKW